MIYFRFFESKLLRSLLNELCLQQHFTLVNILILFTVHMFRHSEYFSTGLSVITFFSLIYLCYFFRQNSTQKLKIKTEQNKKVVNNNNKNNNINNNKNIKKI